MVLRFLFTQIVAPSQPCYIPNRGTSPWSSIDRWVKLLVPAVGHMGSSSSQLVNLPNQVTNIGAHIGRCTQHVADLEKVTSINPAIHLYRWIWVHGRMMRIIMTTVLLLLLSLLLVLLSLLLLLLMMFVTMIVTVVMILIGHDRDTSWYCELRQFLPILDGVTGHPESSFPTCSE